LEEILGQENKDSKRDERLIKASGSHQHLMKTDLRNNQTRVFSFEGGGKRKGGIKIDRRTARGETYLP